MAKDVKTMEDLFLEEIRDLMDAEKQIYKALPRMAKAATLPELIGVFNEHWEQTREHVDRLDRIFSEIGARSGGMKCVSMTGLLKEGDDIVRLTDPGLVRDAGLIAAAQRVEHFEMAGYGSASTFAQLLGRTNVAGLLDQTLNEEKEADDRLSEISESMVSQLNLRTRTAGIGGNYGA